MAAVPLLMLVVMMVVVLVLVLAVLVLAAVVVMVAAAAHAVLIVVVVMVVLVLLVLFIAVGGVGLGGHGQQLGHEIVLLGHGGQDLAAGQVVPGGGDDGGGGVLLPQQGHGGGHLVGVGAAGPAQQDAAGVGDLVVVELAEVLHIQLDLVHVGHRHKAGQLHVQVLGHGLDGAGHVGQLAHPRGLDQDAVGVVLVHHLAQGLPEIAHQGAADAPGVQLVDLDARLFQKAAVDADLAELVLDQHHLLPLEGFTDQLFDQGRLACAQKAGKNVDLGCHISNCLVFFSLYLWDNGVSPANFIHLYYNKPVNGRNSVLRNIL